MQESKPVMQPQGGGELKRSTGRGKWDRVPLLLLCICGLFVVLGAVAPKLITYSTWKPPRAAIEIAGVSDDHEYWPWVFYSNSLVPLGESPIQMPVQARKLTVTLSTEPLIQVDYWVAHIAQRVTLEDGMLEYSTEGTKIAQFTAHYDDLHPSWEDVIANQPYRGDPDQRIERDEDCNSTITNLWDSFYSPPVQWTGGGNIESPNSVSTNWSPASVSTTGLNLLVKDSPDANANDAGEGYLQVAYRYLTLFPLTQFAWSPLYYYGKDAAGNYIADPLCLRTNKKDGYFKWEKLSGPAELALERDAETWQDTVAEYHSSLDERGRVWVRATGESPELNDIQIRLSWGPINDPDQLIEVITWKMTAFVPEMKLEEYYTNPWPDRGYISEYRYAVVHKQDDDAKIPTLKINEHFNTPKVDDLDNNWPEAQMVYKTTKSPDDEEPGTFEDTLMALQGTAPPFLYPEPQDEQPSPNPRVCHYENHVWRGGTHTIEYGIPMETPKTTSYYLYGARREESE